MAESDVDGADAARTDVAEQMLAMFSQKSAPHDPTSDPSGGPR